jgi:hypothetical protein
MSKGQPGQCRDDAREMIPWYVNGTLSDAEAALVREHVDGCGDCRADVVRHTSMHAAVVENEVTPILPKTSAADILSGDRAWRSRSTPSNGMMRRRVAVAAGLAILGVVLIVSLFANRNIDNTNRVYETATSIETATNIDYVLQLRFDEDVSVQQRGEIVAQLDDVVKRTTAFNGDYEIHVRLSAPSLIALEQYQKRAEAIAGVQSAEFTALRLPMR